MIGTCDYDTLEVMVCSCIRCQRVEDAAIPCYVCNEYIHKLIDSVKDNPSFLLAFSMIWSNRHKYTVAETAEKIFAIMWEYAPAESRKLVTPIC